MNKIVLSVLLTFVALTASCGTLWREVKKAGQEVGGAVIVGLPLIPLVGPVLAVVVTGGTAYLIGVFNEKNELELMAGSYNARLAVIEATLERLTDGKFQKPKEVAYDPRRNDPPEPERGWLELLFDPAWLMEKIRAVGILLVGLLVVRWALMRFVLKGRDLGGLAKFVLDWIGTLGLKPAGQGVAAALRRIVAPPKIGGRGKQTVLPTHPTQPPTP